MESAGTVRPRDHGNDNGSTGGSVNGGERASKRHRGLGSGGRGAGYSPPEVSFFLSLLEEHLPVTNKEWKAVVRLHNVQFPSLKRTPNSLRRKFASLCRSVSGADESTLSPDVRRAIHTKRRMKSRGDVPDDDDELPDSDDDDGENEDDIPNTNQRRRESTGENASMQQQSAVLGSTPVAAPHYFTAVPNGQPPVAAAPMVMQMPMAMAPSPQNQFGNNALVQAQAMLDRLADTSGERRAANNTSGRASNEADLIELIKMQLLQNMEDDRRRRADEKERREQERRHRDEERAIRDEFRRRYEEERARREEDLRRWNEERDESRRRHDEFMQLILSLVAKK
jgi:hypothetical protein